MTKTSHASQAKAVMNGGPALPWWHFMPQRKAMQSKD